MSVYVPQEPIAAIATALGPSALSVIRTSGKNCIELIAPLFSRPKALIAAPPHTLLYGWIVNGKEKIDEVMLGVYRSPKSFTGENMVEIFCHGGAAPVLAVYSLLLQNGFQSAQAGEFTFRAFVNGKTDLTRAEAVREIIDAKTDISRSRAAGRLSGSLYKELERIKQLLIHALAEIEAEIEYPEDENAIANAFKPEHVIQAREVLKRLAGTWTAEKLYQDGARIVLCGRTNAGKSSLFNFLLKEERAIVSDVHGTTRDWLESWISFSGIPVRLFDTAGLRQGGDSMEMAGIERSFDLAQDADLLLYLVDAAEGISDEDYGLVKKLRAESCSAEKTATPLILVWNKIDKAVCTRTSAKDFSDARQEVHISVKTGSGMEELSTAVKEILTAGIKTERDQAGIGSLRQKLALDQALDSLNHALEVPSLGLPMDAIVQDLEDALSFMGEITGSIGPDDILENIFSRFCLGK